MNNDPHSRQLVLFPDELLTWETLPDDLQRALQEVLSLLLEQSLHEQARIPQN